jgi:hypothetical protein
MRVSRSRLRWATVVAVVAVVVVAAVVVRALVAGQDDRPRGPLQAYRSDRLSLKVPSWRSFTFANTVVGNPSARPVVLERVRLAGATPGLEIVTASVAGPRRHDLLIAADRIFPPRVSTLTDVHPLRKYVVAPASSTAGGRGAEIVLELRAQRPGRYVFRGVELEYRIGDDDYRTTMPNALAACSVPRGTSTFGVCADPPLPLDGAPVAGAR